MFSNDFSLDSRMVKILFFLLLHKIQRPKVVCMHLYDPRLENREI